MKNFSRRYINTEEKTNTRKALLFILSTIACLALLYFIGIPALGKIASFVSSMKGNDKISSTDTTPPPPPKFKPFPAFSNNSDITLNGNTEAGSTVKLTLNGIENEALSDNNGGFTFNISLQDGINTFAALAIDQAGNQSQKTDDYQITLDKKSPDLEIKSPNDGASFYGSSQRQITITGISEPDTNITINDRIISVDDEGSFQYTTTLNEGSNSFNIKSSDQAGNTIEKSITLNFSP